MEFVGSDEDGSDEGAGADAGQGDGGKADSTGSIFKIQLNLVSKRKA